MFLGRDAAHIRSLGGGQELNTGIQHACDLPRKLALATRGEAGGDVLIQSYDAERRPLAKRVIEQTATLTAVMTVNNPVA